MRLLIALFLPWLTFFTIGRPIAGVVCLLLQITLVGWLPATIWAVYALGQRVERDWRPGVNHLRDYIRRTVSQGRRLVDDGYRKLLS